MIKLDFIQTVLRLFINILFGFFIFFLIILTTFIVYFVFKKDEIIAKSTDWMRAEVYKITGEKPEISIPEFMVKGGDITLFFPQVKLKSGNGELKMQEIAIKFNYLKLFLMKFFLTIEISKVGLHIKTDVISDNQANSFDLEKMLREYFIFYFRSFYFFVDDLELLVNDQVFYLKNVNIATNNQNFDELDAKLKIDAILKQKKLDGMVQLNCQKLKIKQSSCHFEVFDFDDENVFSILNLTKKTQLSNYFEYKSGRVKNLEGSVGFKDKKLDFISFFLDLSNLNFASKYLQIPSDVKIDNGVFEFKYKDKISEGTFKIFSDSKDAFGEFSFQDDVFILDVTGSNIEVEEIGKLWPKRYLKPLAEWLESSIKEGIATRVFVHVKTPLVTKEDLIVDIDFTGGRLHYSSDLPDVFDAKGKVFVYNDPDVLIEIIRGRSGEVDILANTKAIFNIPKHVLTLDLNLFGDFFDYINFFAPDLNVSEIKGKTMTDLKLKLSAIGSANDIFKSVEFNGNMNVLNFKNPFFSGMDVILKVTKSRMTDHANLTLVSGQKLSFNGNCKSSVSAFSADFQLNLDTDNFAFKNVKLKGSDVNFNGNAFFNFKSKMPLLYADIERVNFCKDNDFSIYFSPERKKISIKGESFNLDEVKTSGLYKFLSNLGDNEEHLKTLNIPDFTVDVDLKKVFLLNGIYLKDLHFAFFDKRYFNISSNLIFGYKNANELSLKIPDLGILLDGIGVNNIKLKRGKLTATGDRNRKGEIAGKLTLEDYDVKLFDMNFGERKNTLKFSIKDDILEIKDLRISNIIHTLVIRGTVNMRNLDLNMEANYTPSTLDVNTFLNIIPNASNVFNFVTFNTLKDGIATMIYGVSGTLIKPEFTFRRADTSRKIFTKGVTVWFLILATPLILTLF